MAMASSGGRVGWAQFRWRARLPPYLLILRLTTRGAARSRRSGSRPDRISCRALTCASASVRGGKTRVGPGGPARGPQGAGEAEPVGVGAGLQGDGVHQPADGVVDAQVAIDFLGDAVGNLGAQHHPRAALVGLQLIQGGLELPALRVEGR